ncbi:heat shock protein Hsp20 [Deferribacter desulfuricans SSM1]|uniref:Heat shock protein Hsp20 n=1 Tax=Deferribacter desulfuricans (strain DSM 14783 / JCM 11476 / NBRC 101012 / SSM1) TaxID=639282 RepID=D3P9I9_DEFDS|nr:Hsp20/alpha crystallin family protein [Deferribacter desulfuricans]BAI81379.1 heat shock protein Hsp20 [Deferribacter desulfuricans SSM1]
MAIVRWDPLKDLISIQERINRMFDDTLATRKNSPQTDWIPPVDVLETEKDVVLIVEVPGMKEEDIDIQISDNILTIKGERKLPENAAENYYRLERPYGKFVRSFQLPENVDVNKVKASLKDGILKISIAKSEKEKPKVINVIKED